MAIQFAVTGASPFSTTQILAYGDGVSTSFSVPLYGPPLSFPQPFSFLPAAAVLPGNNAGGGITGYTVALTDNKTRVTFTFSAAPPLYVPASANQVAVGFILVYE
jgi:hypothetical protein